MRSEAPAMAAPPVAGGTVEIDSTGTAQLELTDIVRRFRSRTVLTGANLRVPAGIIAWLGGPNGSGKTTLLRIAAGIVVADSGAVTITGLDPGRDRRACHRRMGYLSAGDRALYARLTVAQNLEFWAGVALVESRRRQELINASLARFELDDLATSRVDRLSTGQRQGVRLAMTFLHEPALVLLDEPHNSLDEHALGLLDAALGALAERGGAALWCSPAPTAALRTNAAYRLQDGRVIRA